MKERLLRVPVLGTVLRMQARYTADAADALAASIGLFGFLSLFPLLALVLAVVGFVLEGDVVAQARVAALVQDSIPAFSAIAGDSSQISRAIESITDNSGSLLGLGSVFLLVAGLRIASGAQQASAVVFRVERPSGLQARLGQLGALLVVGTFALAGAAVSGTVGVELGSGVVDLARSLGGVVLALGLDVGLFLLSYRLFTPGPGPRWRVLLPGSLLAGAGWVALKLFGTSYVTSQATSAQDNGFGAIGSVISLLLLFYLAGRLYLYGAELAALLSHIDDDDHPYEDVAELPIGAEGRGSQRTPRVPAVSPAPAEDVLPAPADAARLAVVGVVLGAAAATIGRTLRR